MTYVLMLIRVLYGGFFFVSGLNYFVQVYTGSPLFENPPPPSPKAEQFMAGMAQTGYMLPLIKGTELVGGLLTCVGFMAPLGIVALGPVVVNIVLWHFMFENGNVPLGSGLAAGYGVLVIAYVRYFLPLLSPMPRTIVAPRREA